MYIIADTQSNTFVIFLFLSENIMLQHHHHHQQQQPVVLSKKKYNVGY